jgi:4-amino-4-deoxy-L-arabinose transferase-like glycosyltransferase
MTSRWVLGGALAVALLLRLPGIQWGLPPITPQVRQSDLRSSYSFDEDDVLSGVAKADVKRLDFDPHEYHWGTLHSELVLLALDGAQGAGIFHTPWRAAYYNLVAPDFVRVYVAGRLVAVAAALVTVWLLFQIGGAWAAMFAAMLVSVSPSHLLQSDQVRVDVTMTALVVLTLLVAVRIGSRNAVPFLVLGIAAGLAIAAKYSAVSVVAAIAIAALWQQRFPWRGILATTGGTLLGFIAGGPYVVIKPRAFYDEISRYMTANAQIPAAFSIPAYKLLGLHVLNLVRFSMGLPAFVLAVVGIVWMLRRRSPFDRIVLAAIAGYTLILLLLHWPLIRYDLPLTVLLGLCAGVALERFARRWRYVILAAALVMPLAASIAQIHYMRSPHPANLMLQRVIEIVPPGTAIARVMPEEPPLDRKVYPMGPDLFQGGLVKNPAPWVLTSNLSDPYPQDVLTLLRSHYDEVARFDSPAFWAWATLGETSTPHDWKYTHCNWVLYRRRLE